MVVVMFQQDLINLDYSGQMVFDVHVIVERCSQAEMTTKAR